MDGISPLSELLIAAETEAWKGLTLLHTMPQPAICVWMRDKHFFEHLDLDIQHGPHL